MTLPLPLQTRRRAVRAILAAGAAMACAPARSADFELRVVTGDATPATQDILAAIGRRWPDFQVASNIRSLMQRRGSAVYVALGPAALEHSVEAPLREPLLSLFSSSEAFTRLVGAAGPLPFRGPISAIHAEAAPLSQMSLIRALYTRRVSVGVLLGAGTRQQESTLREAARTVGLDIDVHLVEPEEDTLRAAARLRASAVLLMIPDRRVYTSDNLRNLLESTYRSNQAMVGFSTSLVNAGTLAAAYSSIDDTVAQVEAVAVAMVAGHRVDPQHPLYWRVAINDNVARSLNVVVTDAARGLGNFPP